MGSSRLVILTAIMTVPVFAQQNDWSRIATIQPRERIAALTKSGKYIQGRFTRWTPDGMEVYASRRQQWLTPVDVKRVWVEKKAPRWRAALIGAAVGFGVAFPIGAASAGYIADQNDPGLRTRMGFGAGFGLFGAGIGAGIGALAGGTKDVLIYRGDKR